MNRLLSLLVVACFAVLLVRAQVTQTDFPENPDIVGSYFGVLPPTNILVGYPVTRDTNGDITAIFDPIGTVMSAVYTFDMTYNTLGYHEGELTAGTIFVDGLLYTLEGSFIVPPFPKKNENIQYDIRFDLPLVNGPTFTTVFGVTWLPQPKDEKGVALRRIQYADSVGTCITSPDDNTEWIGAITSPVYTEVTKLNTTSAPVVKVYR